MFFVYWKISTNILRIFIMFSFYKHVSIINMLSWAVQWLLNNILIVAENRKFLQSIAKTGKTLSEITSSSYELFSKVCSLTESDIRLLGGKRELRWQPRKYQRSPRQQLVQRKWNLIPVLRSQLNVHLALGSQLSNN